MVCLVQVCDGPALRKPWHACGPLGSTRIRAVGQANPAVLSLKVKLWYDKVGHQLIVTILGAKDLPAREDGRPRNPYVKIYFLPDRRYRLTPGSATNTLVVVCFTVRTGPKHWTSD